MYCLDRSGDPVGCLYSFKYRNALYYYQSGIDPALAQWSLGTVLFGYSIQDSINNGVREFHYLRGDEEYKFRWTKSVKKTHSIALVAKNYRGTLYASRVYAKILAKCFAKTMWAGIAHYLHV
jgi:CelD/BcsL family acetyltransferase involved in cellulose biosynthesis